MYCLALGQSDPMMLDLSEIFCFKYFAMMYECTSDIEHIPRPIRKVVSIDMFSASSCYTNFKFRKLDLHTILDLFEFPDYCKLHNNGSMRAEEVFCRGLYELCSGMNQQVMCESVFGREQSQQSFAFKYFINHIFFNFGKLLKQEGFAWWYRNGFLKTSAHAVESKLLALGFPAHFDLPFNVAYWIDCNCLATDVVGGGPAESGANAIRWDESIQRAFYNGWKSTHGLKHQTVNSAYGIVVDIEGPVTLRRNDLRLLCTSRINERMRDLQQGEDEEDQCIIFGDSAYKRLSHISSYLNNTDIIAGEQPLDYRKAYNGTMKKLRISIEWDYGHTATLFPYLTNTNKLKVMKSAVVAKVYTVCTLLKNIHVILYGCETSNYFDLHFANDLLEYYMKLEDLP